MTDSRCPADTAYFFTPMPDRRDFPGKFGTVLYEKAMAEWTRTVAKIKFPTSLISDDPALD